MKYHLKIMTSAEKDLDNMQHKEFEVTKKKILFLADNPRPFGCTKLTDEAAYRIRAGDFRILYRINDMAKEVTIYRIKHRKDVYR